MVNPNTPPDGLPVCDHCGLLIFPAGSAGAALGNGCTCRRPDPQPGLLPAPDDARQLALFPRLPAEPKRRFK